MENTLNIAILPYDIVWGDKEENILSIGECLKTISNDTDIVVLPEMFTTGFITDMPLVNNLCESNSGRTIYMLRHWAKLYNFAICGSFIASTGSTMYNRAFFIEPSGEETFYDKKHLFSIGRENDVYSPGSKNKPIVRFRGWNISFAVCYDLRFPVWCRNIENEYDVLIFVANWPSSRSYAWQQLLIARAIENQSYVIGANRSGDDDFGHYDVNDSIIFDYKGTPITKSTESISQCRFPIKYATLSSENLLRFRNKFPVWKDADKFQIL